jgi:hypothetical protein
MLKTQIFVDTKVAKMSTNYDTTNISTNWMICSWIISLVSAPVAVGSQRHTSAALPPRKTRYPLYRRLDGSRAGLGGAENLTPTGIRSPDRSTRSELMHGLSYPGPPNNFRAFMTVVYICHKYKLRVMGARGGAVFEALRYKPEGSGFDSRWCHWIISVT